MYVRMLYFSDCSNSAFIQLITRKQLARDVLMTLEIGCTTHTKQKSTLFVKTLCRMRVQMLGPTLVPSVNSIVRIVIVTWKLQSLSAAACEVHWETQYSSRASVIITQHLTSLIFLHTRICVRFGCCVHKEHSPSL